MEPVADGAAADASTGDASSDSPAGPDGPSTPDTPDAHDSGDEDAGFDAQGDADARACSVDVPGATSTTFGCSLSTYCTNGTTQVCCQRAGTLACGASADECDPANVRIECDEPSDCGNTTCCLTGAVTDACPATIAGQVRLVCNGVQNCKGTGKYVTCSGACDGGLRCTPLLLPTGRTVGVCL